MRNQTYKREIINGQEVMTLIEDIEVEDEKYFKVSDSTESPEDINYDILGLHKKLIFDKGELLKVEYYKNYDGTTYSDLAVTEDRIYTRAVSTLLVSRNMIIKWYLTNNTVGYTKETVKYYNASQAYNEGKTRRSNVINDASMYLFSQVGKTNAIDFLTDVDAQISLYIKGNTQPIIDRINVTIKTYMTSTIKSTLISILTI